MPKLSVIMNCLDGERYVRAAINSIYAQTYNDWEIIFWDNASTDRTAEIAHSFDQRLRYFRSDETLPLGHARRLAMAEAGGEWIAFLDHDDICLPHRFARQLSAVSAGDFALCYAGMREIDENDRVIGDVLPRHRTGNIFPGLLSHFDANLQTTMINAGYLARFDIGIDPSFVMFEDYNLFMQVAAKGAVLVIPEVLCICRLLSTSATTRALERHSIERFATLDQLQRDNPGIEKRYSDAFRYARARGLYYQSRYEMEIGNHAQARSILRSIRSQDPVYPLLWLASFWPWLWQVIHSRKAKSRLSRLRRLLVPKDPGATIAGNDAMRVPEAGQPRPR